MQDRQEIVSVSLQPRVADGQHDAGHADGQQTQQRQDVFAELLNRNSPMINHSATESGHHTDDDKNGCPYEPMKDDESNPGFDRKILNRETEKEGAIHRSVAGDRFEMNPSPDQRKGDGRGNDASPHDQPE